MFCGTLPAIGAIRAAPRFAMELEDPVLGRKIAHATEFQGPARGGVNASLGLPSYGEAAPPQGRRGRPQ